MLNIDPKWKIFENECVEFLNNNYNTYNVRFIGTGGSDSTVSDILVESTENNPLFSIDCKMPKSQSGQFVLLIDNDRFVFSHRNKSQLDDFGRTIIQYMNDNFDTYKDVGTNSIKINLPSEIFEGWIKKHYANLNTKFIITCDSSNKKIIFPLDKLSKYFTISANFRLKTSGSSNLPNKDVPIVEDFLRKNFPSNFIDISKPDKKYVANFKTQQLTQSLKFTLEGSGYQLANSDSNHNIITKLGNTKNANVIFSLSFNNIDDPDDLKIFTDTLSNI